MSSSTTDALYYEVAEIVRSVLAKEQSLRKAVYDSSYKMPSSSSDQLAVESACSSSSTVEQAKTSDSLPKCNPFGTRYLTEEDDVWKHNAWDNVEWNDEMIEEAEKVIEKQRTQKVETQRVKELLDEPAKMWDAFYSQHTDNFFKDRNWLLKEFPELDMNNHEEKDVVRVLEVGCGVGNTTFPLLQWDDHRRLFLHSCDYSSVAIDVLRASDKYDESRMHGFVWDITQPPPPEAPAPGSLDYIVCIYVLSAIHPSKAADTISHFVSLLKPGGRLLLKDYGRFDLTQLRFKKDRLMEENLYCRGDGTLVYFFSQDELDDLLTGAGLVKKMNHVDRRLIVNRAKQVKMYRQWLQVKYEKPIQTE